MPTAPASRSSPGPRIRNLPQLAAGDQVRVDYYSATTVSMASPSDAGAEVNAVAAGRAPEGAKPGGLAVTSRSLVLTLESYDSSSGLAIFRSPDGLTRRTVVPPEFRTFAERPPARRPRRGDDDRRPGGDDHRERAELTVGVNAATTCPRKASGRIAMTAGAVEADADRRRPAPRSRFRPDRPAASPAPPRTSASPPTPVPPPGRAGRRTRGSPPAGRARAPAGRRSRRRPLRRAPRPCRDGARAH